MTAPESGAQKWHLWSDENFALVARARQNFKELNQQELGRVFYNMLLDILLGLSNPAEIMIMLEHLGLSRYAARLIQGKVSAGTMSPEIDIWALYLLASGHVKFVSGNVQVTAEAERLITNVISFDFSTHPFWRDRT